MILSQTVQRVQPSTTIQISEKMTLLKQKGIDIINLGLGEPDCITPLAAQNAAIKAIREGHVRYPPVGGLLPLRKQIVQFYQSLYGLSYETSDVIVSNGAKQVLSLAFLATLNAGDEVIIPAPYWTSYPEMVRLAGGKPLVAMCQESEGFKITPSLLFQPSLQRARFFTEVLEA